MSRPDNIYSELSVSCIIPMYNEAENCCRIIESAEGIFSSLLRDWEIIVVESGSTDNTLEKIENHARGNDRIHIYHQDVKEGMGSALRLGYSKCTKDIICHLEADSPFDLVYFRKALPILLDNDYVIGYRVGKKEDNFRWTYRNAGKNWLLVRAAFHVGYNLMLRMIFGLIVRDVNFSFKIFKREHIQGLDLVSKGWFIDAELLLELKRKGLLPIEMPIEYEDRFAGRSTVNIAEPFRMIKEMLVYMAKAKERIKLEKRS